MSAEPIDATKLVLGTLRALDDGRRAVTQQWARLTGTNKDRVPTSSDRRRPPQLW